MPGLEVIIALEMVVSYQTFRHTSMNNGLTPRPHAKHSLGWRQAYVGPCGRNFFHHSHPLLLEISAQVGKGPQWGFFKIIFPNKMQMTDLTPI